ncbi:hypothetical protein SDJN03_24168, partial [Cucurbita argyrosperma subsp. sororia]
MNSLNLLSTLPLSSPRVASPPTDPSPPDVVIGLDAPGFRSVFSRLSLLGSVHHPCLDDGGPLPSPGMASGWGLGNTVLVHLKERHLRSPIVLKSYRKREVV